MDDVTEAAAEELSMEPEVEEVAPVEAISEAPRVELLTVRAVRYPSYNPFTGVRFPVKRWVEGVPLDGWLKDQLAAGYIERA